jgi:hypothetical protein
MSSFGYCDQFFLSNLIYLYVILLSTFAGHKIVIIVKYDFKSNIDFSKNSYYLISKILAMTLNLRPKRVCYKNDVNDKKFRLG